ncbi:McbB family protein [Pseudomonas proteolytica]|jgi:McbB family protein|uniref:McbB family protein n=1 Tax=Pseudomonas proteolytica TaxID=219574 RepID=UPI001476192C|nr:McbB family protein [Pseudomonas proteolytica]NMZ23068.1 McbB family protein [Pseudomonas proteolytica]
MNITIPSYEILNLESEDLIVSELGISRIHSKPLLSALRKLSSRLVMAEDEINEVFSEHGLMPSCAFDFLEAAVGLRRDVGEIYFKKTIFVSDWNGRVELEKLLRSELSTCIELLGFSDDLLSLVAGKQYFIVLLCESYDYHAIKKIYFELAISAPESAISVCHRMGDVFCIGQPYMRSIGNPCHFCSVDKVINSERISPARNSWAKIMEICRVNHIEVPSKALTLYQEIVTLGAIIRKVRFYTELGNSKLYQDNILQASYLNLINGVVTEDVCVHWYMCDCLSVA